MVFRRSTVQEVEKYTTFIRELVIAALILKKLNNAYWFVYLSPYYLKTIMKMCCQGMRILSNGMLTRWGLWAFSKLNFLIPYYMFNMVHDRITQMSVLGWEAADLYN